MCLVDIDIKKTEEIVHGRKPGYFGFTPTIGIHPPTDNFTTHFTAASSEYQRITRRRLDAHEHTDWLGTEGPEDVLGELRNQAQAIGKSDGGDGLMESLDPIVRVLFNYSEALAGGISLLFSLVRIFFTAIDVLLSAAKNVAGSYSTLTNLFKRIHLILQSLDVYTGNSLTTELTELLGKIMAQLLSILALQTRVMTEGRIKKFARKLKGRTDVEDALSRFTMFMKEESSLVTARTLDLTRRVDINIKKAEEIVPGRKRLSLPGSHCLP
ncbi:hypothetical protein BC826DRAFT_1106132 [Russula brevipes]|nr:hypothetical protein BC826DRAFT_1106132 [Russula brevipes]